MIILRVLLLFWKPIAGLLAGVGAWWKIRQDTNRLRDLKEMQSQLEGIDRSLRAAAKARADLATGKTPEQIVRENDGAWNEK